MTKSGTSDLPFTISQLAYLDKLNLIISNPALQLPNFSLQQCCNGT